MKCKYLLLLALTFISCGIEFEVDLREVNDNATMANAETVLGVSIDPNQTWTAIQEKSITITADAPLDDIAKVQILTESPFGNDEAEVLNSINCNMGDVVTLKYETPIDLTQLVAACVSSKGIYYIKVFNIGETSVRFSSVTAGARAAGSNYPTAIVLGAATPSYNAQRASASVNSSYKNVLVSDGGTKYYYDAWSDGSWMNDLLWEHQNVLGGNGWNVDRGTICRDITDTGDIATVQSICDTYIKKYGNSVGGKANNWKSAVEGSAYFTVNDNYLISNGNPTTLIPLQMNTTEGASNSIYYYYFNPAQTAGMSSEEEANFLKSLPKYKAVPGFKGDGTCRRQKEYLLPYYGDYSAGTGDLSISNAIPEGYKIGFLNRKTLGNSMSNCKSGCTYGDGRLNVEVNHLIGHYFTPMDKTVSQTVAQAEDGSKTVKKNGSGNGGMLWNSPRIGVFSANNRTYLCFEDGADLNFCDIIIEVCQGTEIIEETMAPDILGAAYLMCFEDRPESADYDMNDVVVYAERIDNNTIAVGLLACGAEDEIILHGMDGAPINDREIHSILGIPEKTFANTEIGKPTQALQVYHVNTSKSIEEYLRGISIQNLTTGKSFKMPERGKSPYIIIVPHNFKYPKEKTSIKSAYPGFLEWASDMNAKRDWFRAGQAELLFKDLFY